MERSRFTDEMLTFADAAGVNPRRTVDELWRIWDLAVGLSLGYVQWSSGMDPDIRNAFPALKMSRFSGGLPANLRKKWKEAGGRIFKGSAIAAKGDGALVAVSAFGLPWPPFSTKCDIDLDDVRRAEALALGIDVKLDDLRAGWWLS